MPDKLTDKEIVKALECCVGEQYSCQQCQYQDIKHYDYDNDMFEIMPNGLQYDQWSCDRWLLIDLLDLINRLQADNERLKDYINTVEKEVDWYRDELRHSDKKVVTKAYKEVFEKLNDKSIRSKAKVKGCGFLYVSVVTLHDINKLKKELGDTE